MYKQAANNVGVEKNSNIKYPGQEESQNMTSKAEAKSIGLQ